MMGERGPVSLPTKIKQLQGTLRPHREVEDEVEPQSPARCPSVLTSGAKQEWKRVAPELKRLGLLTGVDVAGLAAYCECYAMMKATTRILESEGLMIEGEPHPAVKMRNEALTLMRVYLREFGMSPSSRARLKGSPKDEKATDEVFLFGRN